MNLIERSPVIKSETADMLREELSTILQGQHILDEVITIYPPTLKKLGIHADTTYKRKKLYLGLQRAVHSKSAAKYQRERKFTDFMKQKTVQCQKANWEWRIAEEAEQKQLQGWYPFFVTLTVDPKKYEAETLWREGKAFRKYLRSLANVVCRELGHPAVHKPPYRSEREYVHHAGVIEHGKSREHHHGHFMIWMREIPSEWKKDPNEGRLPLNRTQRECKHFRQFWKYSDEQRSPALYYRTKGDIWANKCNHVVPLDPKTREPIKIRGVRAVGKYVSKYMQKDHKEWQHRMKCTRNLGMTRLKEKIAKMKPKTVEALSWRPKTSSQNLSVSLIHGVPLGLVRSIAKHQHFYNQLESKQLVLKKLMKTNYEHYTRMLKSVQDGARPDRMHSLAFFDWVSYHLPDQKGYSKKRLLKSHNKLAKQFPRERRKVDPIVIGANDIGFTYSV